MNNKQKAEDIIKRYTLYSIGAGLLPFPILDLAAVSAVQVAMIKELAKTYEVKFSDHQITAITTALIGSGSARIGASLAKSIPIIGSFVSGVSMSLLSGAVTYAIGSIITDHFNQGGNLENFNAEKAQEALKNKIQEGINVVKDWQKQIEKQFSGKDNKSKKQAGAGNGAEDIYSKLEKLYELKEKGVITEEEFQEQKKKLLENL